MHENKTLEDYGKLMYRLGRLRGVYVRDQISYEKHRSIKSFQAGAPSALKVLEDIVNLKEDFTNYIQEKNKRAYLLLSKELSEVDNKCNEMRDFYMQFL
tara:strand:- start:105572 stop:105868 length:297 start_codon:yes stop_codon:yes gene_type:complete